MIRTIVILALLLSCAKNQFAQTVPTEYSVADPILNSRVEKTDSGVYLIDLYRNGCKNTVEARYFIANPSVGILQPVSEYLPPVHHQPGIIVHGNISYNFNYRSYIDTPFAEKDIMQHSVQARLNVKLKDKYPFTVYLTSRRSNSPYFSNATDISFQFRQAEMLEDIKRKMRTDAESILSEKRLLLTPAQIYQREKDGMLKSGAFSLPDEKSLSAKKAEIEGKFQKLYDGYKTKMDKLVALQNWARHSSRDQELIEEKEKKLRGNTMELKDSVAKELLMVGKKFYDKRLQPTDSIFKGAKELSEEKRREIDSLKKEIAKTERELKAFQKNITDSVQQLRKKIAAIKDRNTLYEYLQSTGQSTGTITRLQKNLLAVKQIGIGRTWIDYSELTVRNISLNGINVEANPGNVYLAAAAGKVNYRFRDYIVKGNYAGSNQSVGLLRAGFGKKDRSNFIVTYYSGKKALLNQGTIADSNAVQNIAGLSIEARAALDANNYLVGEYAKSTSPALKGKLNELKDHTNEAWSLKLFTHYGNTKLTSYYRRTGENFQSFTLFPTNNKQDAWMVKASQAIWKKQIILDAAVRKNDFNSPIALPDLSNQNVFKSFQITERIKKLPFASIGYYPSSQLTLSNNNVLYENRYNTLNALISHSYFFRKLSMNSNATYTKFYNSGIDSGFIYYNASTFTFSHSVNVSRFIFQGILTLTDQSQLHQLALEPGITYQVKNKLSLSGSIKWSRLNHMETLWGGTAGLNLYLKSIGVLQFQYDKIYLPGYNRNLLPVDMGRLTFSRDF